ncbi:MAG: DUF4177 domain-containing protein [Desulfatiglandaceae bacterium]
MRKQFLYDVKKYATEEFIQLVYFCTEQGACNLDQLPAGQMKAFEDVLNRRGSEGWELVQTFFGSDGVVTIWKQEQPWE